MNQETENHLKILGICYYVMGGLLCLLALIPCLHIILGIAMLSGKMDGAQQPSPAFMGIIFLAMGLTAVLLILAIAITTIYTGRCLRQRKYYIFCLVMAGLCCCWFPLGTVLGVFSIIVLSKPEVKPEFEKKVEPPPQPVAAVPAE